MSAANSWWAGNPADARSVTQDIAPTGAKTAVTCSRSRRVCGLISARRRYWVSPGRTGSSAQTRSRDHARGSLRPAERQEPFVRQVARVPQAGEHVVDDELRVVADHLRRGQAFAEQPQDGGDRHPGAPHARNSAHDSVINKDTIHGADRNPGVTEDPRRAWTTDRRRSRNHSFSRPAGETVRRASPHVGVIVEPAPRKGL